MEHNNTVIEVLTKEHGKEVISYFKSLGIDTNGREGKCNREYKYTYRYYGLINGKFDNYGLLDCDCNVKIITLPTENNMEQMLTRKQLIIAAKDYTCPKWRDSIIGLLAKYPYKLDEESIVIPTELIILLDKEGTVDQKQYIKNLGIEIKKDKNAFVSEIPVNYLYDISRTLFNDKYALAIMYDSTPKDRPDLKYRALHIDKNYEVKTGLSASGGTYIEILKK